MQDEAGRRLGKAKPEEGIAGIAGLHGLIGEQLWEGDQPVQVVVGIKTDRGPWVQALIGYQVYAMNPLQVARYRERHAVSGAKSDAGDAHALADMVRTDRHQLRTAQPEDRCLTPKLHGMSVDSPPAPKVTNPVSA